MRSGGEGVVGRGEAAIWGHFEKAEGEVVGDGGKVSPNGSSGEV